MATDIKTNPKILRPGDVLLYHGEGLVSWAIRLFDGTEYSHAGLALGDREVTEVGEALALGLERRAVKTSVKNAKYVHARRLKDRTDLAPVVERGELYLNEPHRYAYEQLLLLAVLSLTRKLPGGRMLKLVLRRVMDAAALVLARIAKQKVGNVTGNRREPMICSEFVYRCYDEALPDRVDVFSLRVGAELLFSGRRFAPLMPGVPVPVTPGVHPESLLAHVAARSSRLGFQPDRASRSQMPKMTEKKARSKLDEAIELYAAELAGDDRVAVPEEVSDDQLVTSVVTFAGQHLSLAPPASRHRMGFTGATVLPHVPDAVAHLFRTAADFVTPGDLFKTDSLFTVG